MHQVQKVYSDTMKEEVQRALLDRMLTAIEKEEVTLAETKIIANYVLDNMDKLTTYTEMLEFLRNLQKKWPIFTTVEKHYEQGSSQSKEKIVIDRLASYLNKLN